MHFKKLIYFFKNISLKFLPIVEDHLLEQWLRHHLIILAIARFTLVKESAKLLTLHAKELTALILEEGDILGAGIVGNL